MTTTTAQNMSQDNLNKVMNQMTHSTLEKPSFVDEAGQDFASFLDLSFTESAAALPTPTLFSATSLQVQPLQSKQALTTAQPVSFAHAFSRQDDSMLDSPLGLSPASLGSTSSPFEFGGHHDFNSPLISGVYDTPDLLDGTLATPVGEFSSLFGDAPSAFKSVASQQQNNVIATVSSAAVMSAPVLAPTMIAVSPSLMSLDGEELAGPPTPSTDAELVDVKPVISRSGSVGARQTPKVGLSRLGKTEEELAMEDAMSRMPVKDKFTGTRNTKIKAIPLDAPTIQKNYAVPSATSRKRAPSAVVATKLISGGSGAKSNKRAKRDSTPQSPQVVEMPIAPDSSVNPEDLPEDLLTAIELKRRQNTLAARRSRMRKAEHLNELKSAIEERDQRIAALEEEVLALRRRLGE